MVKKYFLWAISALFLSLSFSAYSEPKIIDVGIKIQQLSEIHLKQKSFETVTEVLLRWQEDELAFTPESGDIDFRFYKYDDFVDLLNEKGLIEPLITFYNSYGRTDYQNDEIMISKNGEITRFLRFSTGYHLDELNFKPYPFDQPVISILIDSLLPSSVFQLHLDPSISGVADTFRNEEWRVLDVSFSENTHIPTKTFERSRVQINVKVSRNLVYYVLRIFVPLLVIVTISWFTFFLKDYSKRIDVASANLMTFVAFNFILAADLPRIGYMTLLDVMILLSFAMLSITILVNVILRRLELAEKIEEAKKVDHILLTLFPLSYAILAISFWITSHNGS